jgi:hypothetical protein
MFEKLFWGSNSGVQMIVRHNTRDRGECEEEERIVATTFTVIIAQLTSFRTQMAT